MAVTFESVKQAADTLTALLPDGFVPQFGIIGGSGLSALEQAIAGPRTEVPYGQIQGFPISTGMSHSERGCNDLRELYLDSLLRKCLSSLSSGPCWKTGLWICGFIKNTHCSHERESSVSLNQTKNETIFLTVVVCMKGMNFILPLSQSEYLVFWESKH